MLCGKETQPSVTNFCTSEMLHYYFPSFCLTDIDVDCDSLVFKKQHNGLPYGKCVTVTETVFTKRRLACKFLVKNATRNFMKKTV